MIHIYLVFCACRFSPNACLCRVETCAKTAAGTRKFISGSKLCIQPSVWPSIHPSKHKISQDDGSCSQSPLLPSLPDDLVIACLIRIPRMEHRKLRLVCKRWYRIMAGNYFYSLHKTPLSAATKPIHLGLASKISKNPSDATRKISKKFLEEEKVEGSQQRRGRRQTTISNAFRKKLAGIPDAGAPVTEGTSRDDAPTSSDRSPSPPSARARRPPPHLHFLFPIFGWDAPATKGWRVMA
ncbi:hypothetical protein ACLOJK_025856 [Asimina triloba]